MKEQYFKFETRKSIDKEKFDDFVKNMPKSVYRAKGFVKTNNGDLLFNYVAGRHDFEEFKIDKTELVFIGEHIDKLKNNVLKELEKTLL